jgi:hypothetical protein
MCDTQRILPKSHMSFRVLLFNSAMYLKFTLELKRGLKDTFPYIFNATVQSRLF